MQVRTEYKIAHQIYSSKNVSLNMRLKTVHISNRTKFFWKRVPERWCCYHKSSIT